MQDQLTNKTLMTLTAELSAAYVSNHTVEVSEIASVVDAAYEAIRSKAEVPENQRRAINDPAVPIEQSITPDYIFCLEDGKKLKTLTRYIHNYYGLTPDQYRKKWGLEKDYPMVAPNYVIARNRIADTMALSDPSE